MPAVLMDSNGYSARLILAYDSVQISISRGTDGATILSHVFKKEPSDVQFAPSRQRNGAVHSDTVSAVVGARTLTLWKVG